MLLMCLFNILLTHFCPPLRSTFSVRETASLGQQMLNATVTRTVTLNVHQNVVPPGPPLLHLHNGAPPLRSVAYDPKLQRQQHPWFLLRGRVRPHPRSDGGSHPSDGPCCLLQVSIILGVMEEAILATDLAVYFK